MRMVGGWIRYLGVWEVRGRGSMYSGNTLLGVFFGGGGEDDC